MNIRNKYILAAVISLLIPLCLGGLFLWDNQRISRIEPCEISDIVEGVECEIEEITIMKSQIYISGWAFKEEPIIADRSILLRNISDSSEVWKLNTIMEERIELNEIYNGSSYKNAGFAANGTVKKEMKDKTYEILIYIRDVGNESLFNTGRQISF